MTVILASPAKAIRALKRRAAENKRKLVQGHVLARIGARHVTAQRGSSTFGSSIPVVKNPGWRTC